MRRDALSKVKSNKPPKASKTQQNILDRKAYGAEYVPNGQLLSSHQLTSIYNWYNYMKDNKDAKAYLETYLKNTNRLDELEKLKGVSHKYVVTTAGWIARLRTLGALVPESTKKYFERALADTLKYSNTPDEDEEQEEVQEITITAPKKKSSRYQVVDWAFQEEMDNVLTGWKITAGFSPISIIAQSFINSAEAKRLHDRYNPELLEIENAYLTDDKEGFENLYPDKLKVLYGFLVMIVEDLEQHIGNNKNERKPRAKKPISVEKKLKDFKWKKSDPVRNISSIAPEKILGATELWAFNTNYNQLTVFKAPDGQKLDVYRTAISNYDPSKTLTKKLKAKEVNEILRQVLTNGKVGMRDFMGKIRGTPQKLQERMNENTILLRAL